MRLTALFLIPLFVVQTAIPHGGRTLVFMLSTLLLLANAKGQMENYDSLKTEKANRLAELTSIESRYWSEYTLTDLLDFEEKISVARRLHQDSGLRVEWQNYTLQQLLDFEERIRASRRLKRNYGLDLEWQDYTLSQLLDVESRVAIASRIKRAYAIEFDWSRWSEAQLAEAEKRIYTADLIKRDYGREIVWSNYSAAQLSNLHSDLAYDQARRERAEVEKASKDWLGASKNSKKSEVIAFSKSNSSQKRSANYLSSSPTKKKSRRANKRNAGAAYGPLAGDHWVDGYYRSDGTYVKGHHRSNRDSSFWNNYSSRGNVNPYTGSIGTKTPSSSRYSGGTGRVYVSGYYRSDGTYVRSHTRSK